ncbi:hypothetical protein B8W72_20840 [Pseudomonas putida]|uniref:Uncharacterized protein n=1 Tax=Pseudomonas putida TaxID=303 RepID=A0A1Y3KR02_PSEPU|nr:hypothetical protein [Pseudomonas putida]OUM28307.1 hypothetical protein B8W72_20840 [Pseudomonas putida]
MPAMFKNHDDEYFVYKDAELVKERGNQYVVMGANHTVLGVHPIESIAEMTTDPLNIEEHTPPI